MKRDCPRCGRNKTAKRFCFGVCDTCYKADRYKTDPHYREHILRQARERAAHMSDEAYAAKQAKFEAWREKNRDKVREYTRTYNRLHRRPKLYAGKRVVLLDGREGVLVDIPQRMPPPLGWAVCVRIGDKAELIRTSDLVGSRSRRAA